MEQYAGRLHREYPGKKNVYIFDYVDTHIPVFDKMYAKRLKTYKRIGYSLHTSDASEKQSANATFFLCNSEFFSDESIFFVGEPTGGITHWARVRHVILLFGA